MRKASVLLPAGIAIIAQSLGGLFIDESEPVAVVVIIVAVSVVLMLWALESGLDKLTKRWEWAANHLGARLGDGSRVHGWWYTRIYSCEGRLLGGSVTRIRATRSGFEVEGCARMFDEPRCEEWSGHGSPSGADGLLYDYRGDVGEMDEDEGHGLDHFHGGDPARNYRGVFYGKGLPHHPLRITRGTRCPAEHLTKAFLRDPQTRVRQLDRHLDGFRDDSLARSLERA